MSSFKAEDIYSEPIGPTSGIRKVAAQDPFRNRDTEMVTITLERYEALKTTREVVEVKQEGLSDKDAKILRGQVNLMNKKIGDLESHIKTYQRFLGALSADLSQSLSQASYPDAIDIVGVFESTAKDMGHNINVGDNGISLEEEDIYDAVARQRERDEHFEDKGYDLPY